MGESSNSKSSGQLSFIQNDSFVNMLNIQSDQNGVSYGQGNSFGQKGLAGSSFGQQGYDNKPYLLPNEVWKSQIGQEMDFQEQIYQGYNLNLTDQYVQEDNTFRTSNDFFEMKFENLQIEQPKIIEEEGDLLQIQKLQQNKQYKSKSLISMEDHQNSFSHIHRSNHREQIKLQNQILEFKLENGEQISFKFKPENRNMNSEIIEENSELFNVNMAKSLYVNKINQLIEHPIRSQSPNLSVSPRSKSQQKYQRKQSQTMNKEKDSDYSSNEFYDQVPHLSQNQNEQQDKLSKNRESARNSRKRKKIYIELLETKVAELTDECNRLKELCKTQNKQATLQDQDSQIIKNFLEQQSELFDKLDGIIKSAKTPQTSEVNLILDALRYRTSSNTKERLKGAENCIKQMIDISLPLHGRYLIQTSELSKDLFSTTFDTFFQWSQATLIKMELKPEQLQRICRLKPKLKTYKTKIEQDIGIIKETLNHINQEAGKVDQLMDQIRGIFNPIQVGQLYCLIHQNTVQSDLQTTKIFNALKSSFMSEEEDERAEEPKVEIDEQLQTRKQIKLQRKQSPE